MRKQARITSKGEVTVPRDILAPLLAIVIVTALAAPRAMAQTLAVVDPPSGLRLLVAEENTLPTLRILLPGEPASTRGIEVVFPEHVTGRAHAKTEPEHLYLWRPGQRGNRPAWRRAGQSLEYEMDLENHVHMLARATLEPDGVRYHYIFDSRGNVAYDMLTAVTDPRLAQLDFPRRAA